MSLSAVPRILIAVKKIDWSVVAGGGGAEPCFHIIEEGTRLPRFCLMTAAEHGDGDHEHVSLHELITEVYL